MTVIKLDNFRKNTIETWTRLLSNMEKSASDSSKLDLCFQEWVKEDPLKFIEFIRVHVALHSSPNTLFIAIRCLRLVPECLKATEFLTHCLRQSDPNVREAAYYGLSTHNLSLLDKEPSDETKQKIEDYQKTQRPVSDDYVREVVNVFMEQTKEFSAQIERISKADKSQINRKIFLQRVESELLHLKNSLMLVNTAVRDNQQKLLTPVFEHIREVQEEASKLHSFLEVN